ncbi:MAG: hypothetical protein JWO22_3872 [Frankiales bacterium]|nr:hypothetical protein [Frankiales bacterium]
MNKLLPLLVVAFSLPVPAQAAEPGSGLASYAMIANAPGIAVEGLYRDVAVTLPETTSTLSTGGVGAALATLAWPGPIAGNLGTTILVLSDQAPPQVTLLNDPVRAEARSGGTQNASYSTLPGTLMSAHATGDTVTASSRTGSTTLPVGGVGAFSGETRTAFTNATQSVATATGLVQDVSLAGGVIHIGSVTSKAEAKNDGGTVSGTGSTVVTGLTVAGVPVQVDDKGLHVASTNVPLATATVTDAVKAIGLTALLTQPRVTKSAGAVSVTAGALVLMYTRGASTYAFTIGRAAVGLAASRSGSGLTLPPLPLPTGGSAALPVTSLPRTDAPVTGSQAPPLAAPMTAPSPPQAFLPSIAAATARLAGGATGLGVAGLVLLAGLLVIGMKRLPDKVLAVDTSDCDEWPR